MKERPLVAFTLLTQMAVGAFLTLGALDVWAGGLTGQPSAHALTNGALLATGPVVAAALFASLLHLGTPRNAWRSLANLRSSWLSREVLFALGFAGLGGLFAALRWSGAGAPALRSWVALAAGLCGIALVYAMARVYRLRTVKSWDTPLTAVSFFATTLLLGSLGVGTGLVLLPDVPDALVTGPLRAIALVAAGCFGAEVAAEGGGTLHGIRRLLLLVGLALCVVLLLAAGRATALVVLAFGVALAAQVLGRYLFYVTGLSRSL
jgi:anaerobic dimethyl sulfoxide reductase subunit C (anchor subunit)